MYNYVFQRLVQSSKVLRVGKVLKVNYNVVHRPSVQMAPTMSQPAAVRAAVRRLLCPAERNSCSAALKATFPRPCGTPRADDRTAPSTAANADE